MSLQITIEYFAVLREQAKKDSEIFPKPDSLAALYSELKEKYNFTLEQSQLRVAINDSFVEWDHPISENDKITFIPPVAGGQ